MAAMSFCHVSLPLPELFPSSTSNYRSSAAFPSTRRNVSVFAAASPETSTAPPANPEIELEFFGGKLMNCGGGGSCGTCIVEILDGKDLLNERTNTELRYLKKKPESWRLACQTIVGNKENSGKVVVQRLPQKK